MSTTNNKIILPCEEANHVCDKSQYKEASFWEKLKLSLHLLYCKACRKYSKNNAKLSKIIDGSNVDCLKQNDKQKMNDCFEKELQQHQH